MTFSFRTLLLPVGMTVTLVTARVGAQPVEPELQPSRSEDSGLPMDAGLPGPDASDFDATPDPDAAVPVVPSHGEVVVPLPPTARPEDMPATPPARAGEFVEVEVRTR